MKSKIIYIIAGVFCILGALLIFSGAAASDFSFSEMAGHTITESEYTANTDVTKIVVSDTDADIRIVSSLNSLKDKITVKEVYSDNQWYNVSEYKEGENQVLNIYKVDTREWYDYIFNIDFVYRYIEIEVPREKSCEIELSNVNGSIFVEKLNCSNLSATSEHGRILLSDVNVEGDLSVYAEEGEYVALIRAKIGGKADLSGRTSPLILDSIEAESIRAVTEYSHIKLYNIETVGDIIAETENSYIHINYCNFGGKMSLSNIYGEIEGTLSGSIEDYTVRTSANKNMNSLPRSYYGGEKMVEIHSYNGSISVYFEEGEYSEENAEKYSNEYFEGKNPPDMTSTKPETDEYTGEPTKEVADETTDESDEITDDEPAKTEAATSTEDEADSKFDIPPVTMKLLPIFLR